MIRDPIGALWNSESFYDAMFELIWTEFKKKHYKWCRNTKTNGSSDRFLINRRGSSVNDSLDWII